MRCVWRGVVCGVALVAPMVLFGCGGSDNAMIPPEKATPIPTQEDSPAGAPGAASDAETPPPILPPN